MYFYDPIALGSDQEWRNGEQITFEAAQRIFPIESAWLNQSGKNILLKGNWMQYHEF